MANSETRVDVITDTAGTGSPSFPNGTPSLTPIAESTTNNGTDVEGRLSGVAIEAGYLGEIQQTSVTSSTTGTSSTPVNLSSLSLPAGNWYLEGQANCSANTSTDNSRASIGINTTSATLPSTYHSDILEDVGFDANSGGDCSVTVSGYINISSTTTVYLVGQWQGSANINFLNSYIRAYRVS